MRREFLWVAVLGLITVTAATSAWAENWCGYAAHANAIIECGYSTVADCENAIGKGAMCFIDPNYALNSRRAVGSRSRLPQSSATLVFLGR